VGTAREGRPPPNARAHAHQRICARAPAHPSIHTHTHPLHTHTSESAHTHTSAPTHSHKPAPAQTRPLTRPHNRPPIPQSTAGPTPSARTAPQRWPRRSRDSRRCRRCGSSEWRAAPPRGAAGAWGGTPGAARGELGGFGGVAFRGGCSFSGLRRSEAKGRRRCWGLGLLASPRLERAGAGGVEGKWCGRREEMVVVGGGLAPRQEGMKEVWEKEKKGS
jgi:hypothetical protein